MTTLRLTNKHREDGGSWINANDVMLAYARTIEAEYQAAEPTKDKELYEARWNATKQRAEQNEQILRDRYLRKSNAALEALKILEVMQNNQEVPVTEVERVVREVRATMNPNSPSYAPPVVPTEGMEDQAIVLNRLLNEKNMTNEEGVQFVKWIGTEGATQLSAQEQDVARESLGGFLRIAHSRWEEGSTLRKQEAQRAATVAAVKTVQRVQKEAARAASSSPGAPRKQPAGQQQFDTKKLTHADQVALLRQMVEENR